MFFEKIRYLHSVSYKDIEVNFQSYNEKLSFYLHFITIANMCRVDDAISTIYICFSAHRTFICSTHYRWTPVLPYFVNLGHRATLFSSQRDKIFWIWDTRKHRVVRSFPVDNILPMWNTYKCIGYTNDTAVNRVRFHSTTSHVTRWRRYKSSLRRIERPIRMRIIASGNRGR